ncbi:hypothetical protein P3T18_000345 [Paraburkholderia sp. GAS199]|uniref:hypothetical protein n=1 Tax=Paraburkholderia sp. GAS199 TaxID=3035126 RepID=UPI003D1FE47F
MMCRAIITTALIVCTQACAAQQRVTNDDIAATRAADITRTYGLSTDATECLLFDTADKGEFFLVRVRENHTQACGGVAGVSPTLFFLKMRKRDGYTVTTAYDSEHYLPLKHR